VAGVANATHSTPPASMDRIAFSSLRARQ